MMWDLSGSGASHGQPRSWGGGPSFPVPQTMGQMSGISAPGPYPPSVVVQAGPSMSSSYHGYTSSEPFMGHSSPGERGAGRHTQHRSHGHHKHHSSSQKISGQLMVPMVSHRPHSSPGRVKPSTSGQQPQHRPTHVHHHSAQPVLQHANFTEPPVHPGFRYSKCTGRKKALCIGINYRGQPNELRGCINDAKNVKNFLVRNAGYREGDIVILTDDPGQGKRQIPTRQNILDAMRWLVSTAQPNDSLVFHYSGHGGQTRDKDGDEVDGWDEVIFPLDHKTRGHIVDDLMHSIMVKPLPAGCRLTALFDSCHSGTALDLPFIYSSNGRLKGSHVSSRARARKATPADVISWTGCKDSQTSADTFANGMNVGAMSNAFITAMRANPNQSYASLLASVREILRKKYSQKPQLSSSHPIDTNLKFIL